MIRMIGGRGESHANIAEGLAAALEGFNDLQAKREPNVATHKHCILICNSPPYQVPVTESSAYFNFSLDQVVSLFPEVCIACQIS